MPEKSKLGNSLADVNSKLSTEWHPTKNGDLTPHDVTIYSHKKVWWKCNKGDGHEWVASVASRSSGNKCPICANQKIVSSNCLATLSPSLAKEWHPTKNGNLTPYNVGVNSNKKVWWKCDKGDDHEWVTSVNKRTSGRGCPICTNKKIVSSNCLATLNPSLAKEWHPTKNGDLTSYDIGINSNKKAWWKCDKGDDHEWVASIGKRTSGTGCPICTNQKIISSNCLATLNPSLAKEWHPAKNGDLTPNDVGVGSSKKVWWKCDKGDDHEWSTTVESRTSGKKCPICANLKIVSSNCLATLNPSLASEWHPTKNGDLMTNNVGVGSSKKVWWKCDKGDDHEWMARVEERSKGKGCPICANQKIVSSNCLATLNPSLATEWHPTKNGDLTPYNVGTGSTKKVWWKCDKDDDHEWMAPVEVRSHGIGCSVCAGKKIVISNCLATINPELAKEWHPTKNGDLTPYDISIGSNKKIWWKCPEGEDHEWMASVATRSNGHGCPICVNQKIVVSNCLATTNPELAKEWHPSKNDKLTPFDFVGKSGKKVWWKCPKSDDHEWKASIKDRSNDRGCPYCTLTPQSKQELTITFELIQFFEINPRGFKMKIRGKLLSIDIYISEFNLGIEFDGNYWHKGKRELDKLKTVKLEAEGMKIIRIRETPLKKINETDIISELPFNAKKVTDEVLKHIMEVYSLDKVKSQRINRYFRKRSIQNKHGLIDYIDLILSEKAEKKRNKRTTTESHST